MVVLKVSWCGIRWDRCLRIPPRGSARGSCCHPGRQAAQHVRAGRLAAGRTATARSAATASTLAPCSSNFSASSCCSAFRTWPPSTTASEWPSLYDSTFSKAVSRLYGGAKGLVMWY